MATFHSFHDLPNDNFGGKANSLAALFTHGFRVPNGFVVPASEIEQVFVQFTNNTRMPAAEKRVVVESYPSHFTPLIQETWEHTKRFFDGPIDVAIRSSINLEDGSTFSFAGQFTTVLHVTNFEDFTAAMLACIGSTYNQVALSYCHSNDIDCEQLRVNLVIQKMVDPDHAGVCFTVNPLTGNEKEILIESIDGLGENLVQGTATPSSYKVNWFDDTVTFINQVQVSQLSDEAITLVVDEALKIQQLYGYPVDIEWAIKENELYILQARPMTAIRFDTQYDWTNADLKDGGIASEIATPFMYSLYEQAFVSTMSPYLKSVKIHPKETPDLWFTQYMLYAYWNLTAVKDGVKKIPGFIEREFDNDLGIDPQYEGKGHVTKTNLRSIVNGLQVLFALKKSIKETLKTAPAELTRIEGIIAHYANIDVHSLSNDALLQTATTLIHKHFLEVEGTYFRFIYTNSNNTTLFKEYLDKKNKSGKIEYLNLITGLQNVSHLRPSYELWSLSRVIRASEHRDFITRRSAETLCADYLAGTSFPFRENLEALIHKYGYKSEKELHILVPNWNQQPMQVFATLKSFMDKEDTESSILQNERQHAIFEQEFAKIGSNKMRNAILQHRQFLWYREEFRDRSSQMYGVIRTYFCEMGERLKAQGILAEVEDLFFLSPKEGIELFGGKHELLDLIRKNKIIFQSFRNFDRPNEIWRTQRGVSKKKPATGNLLQGIACSNGIVEGEVYIARSVAEANEMPNGMIMVTKFTDPAWTLYFAKIKGLVTETGGMLSHGAIISREYGIPAVLAVPDALSRLKSGSKIRLNGNDGTIEILKR